MRNYTEEEICETVFYLARYAECLEIDKVITVPDERELFWMLLEWAQEFTQAFAPDGDKDYIPFLGGGKKLPPFVRHKCMDACNYPRLFPNSYRTAIGGSIYEQRSCWAKRGCTW